MMLFNTFLGVVALIVAGLIGATITFLLMHLGLPKPNENESQYNKLIALRKQHDWLIKQHGLGTLSEESKEVLQRSEEIMDENRRFR